MSANPTLSLEYTEKFDVIPNDVERVGLNEVLTFLRSYSLLLLAFLILGAGAGIAYLKFANSSYVAIAEILIDPKQPRILNRTDEAGLMQFTIDSSQIESQIEILKSDRISRRVLKDQHLDADGEYSDIIAAPAGKTASFGGAMLKSVEALFSIEHLRGIVESTPDSSAEPSTPEDGLDSESRRLATFERNLNVRRLGQSYVLAIGLSSRSPRKAARLANSVAAAYILDQLGANLEAATNGGELLQSRIDDLHEKLAVVRQSVESGEIAVDTFPSADARVITAATVPPGRSWPKTVPVLLLSSAMGLLAGILFAVVNRALDNSTQVRRDIERVAGLKFLGSVRKQKRGNSRIGMLTKVVDDPNSAFGDDIRGIQTSIKFACSESKVRCIGITSCFPGEGKSTIAYNLANAYAMQGHRAILVDSDTRSPRRVSRILAGESAFRRSKLEQEIVDTSRSDLCEVRGVLVGEQSRKRTYVSAEEKTRQLLELLRKSYDIIILDITALSVAQDARSLCPQLDGLIIVSRCGHTPKDAIADAVSLTSQSRVRILGCVLNGTPRPRGRSLF